jgi:gamma-glutamylcyclotransferase (GGCT)/AIG2-like uncharacterized protein YtfP
VGRDVRYFAYGTLQRNFSNYERFAGDLGEPLGRYRTVEPFPLVVPREAACTNPGCGYVHRMGVLLPDAGRGHCVEGELFAIEPGALAALDELESAYVRRRTPVEPLDGGEPVEAEVYFVADAAPWRALLAAGAAAAVARYERAYADGPLKQCCVRRPGHDGPHDIVPLSLHGLAP